MLQLQTYDTLRFGREMNLFNARSVGCYMGCTYMHTCVVVGTRFSVIGASVVESLTCRSGIHIHSNPTAEGPEPTYISNPTAEGPTAEIRLLAGMSYLLA